MTKIKGLPSAPRPDGIALCVSLLQPAMNLLSKHPSGTIHLWGTIRPCTAKSWLYFCPFPCLKCCLSQLLPLVAEESCPFSLTFLAEEILQIQFSSWNQIWWWGGVYISTWITRYIYIGALHISVASGYNVNIGCLPSTGINIREATENKTEGDSEVHLMHLFHLKKTQIWKWSCLSYGKPWNARASVVVCVYTCIVGKKIENTAKEKGVGSLKPYKQHVVKLETGLHCPCYLMVACKVWLDTQQPLHLTWARGV